MIFGATIRLKDQFTSTIRRAREETKTFRKEVDQSTTKLRLLGRMIVRPVIAVKDQASKVIGGIGRQLKSLQALAAVALVGLGVGKALSGGMMLERQQISMQHFIGTQNQGMDAAAVKKASDEYVQWLRDYANATPFSTDEVIGGGARAINVAGGDINKAKELAKIAGDMAALNPEKTFADAMEALADLRVGETERMKEFGFKISQDDIKAAGGVDAVINKQIMPFFEGGAAKLAESSAGLWSTITGNFGTALTTTGEGMLKGLKPQLQSAVKWITDNGDTISGIATKTGATIGRGIETVSGWISRYMPQIKAGIASVMDWMGPKIDWVGSKVPVLKSMWADAWPTISSVLQTAWKIASPILSAVWSAIKIVWGIFEAAWPSIVKVVEVAWRVLEPIFNALAKGLDLIARGVKWVAEKFDANPSEVKVAGSNVVSMGEYRAQGLASGLSYVPYDNYPALLHRGERVMTAADNRQYQRGRRPSTIIFEKLADRIDASNPADVDMLLDKIEQRLLEVEFNSGNASVA